MFVPIAVVAVLMLFAFVVIEPELFVTDVERLVKLVTAVPRSVVSIPTSVSRVPI